MKRFKIVSAIMILCMLCSFIGISTTLEEGSFADGTVSLITGDIHIVRPAESVNGVNLSAKLYKALTKQSSAAISMTDDTGEEFEKEIIIGDSDRAETAYAYSILSQQGGGLDDDYIICEIDGDVVITGNSEKSTEIAVERFCNNYLSQGEIESGTVEVNVSSQNATYTKIKVNDKTLQSWNSCIITPKYNMSYIVGIQVDNLVAAIKTSAGFTINKYDDFSVPNDIDTANKAGSYGYAGYMNCDNATEWLEYKSKYYNLDKTKTRTTPLKTFQNTYGYSCEIIIGNCDRDGVPTVTNKEEYTIKVSGTKVFINGGSPYATAMGVSEFARMISEGNLSLTDSSGFNANYYDTLSSYDKSTYYTLAWGDDFEGNKINEALWYVSHDGENTYSTGLNGRNNYRASKDLKNNYVKDGKFYIDAVYTDDAYYGGMLITDNSMRYKYGYVESSSLLPSGQGFWSSLWLSSPVGEQGLAYTEIDVNECYGPGHYVLCNTFAHLSTTGLNQLKELIPTTTKTYYHKRNDNCGSDNRGYYLDFHTFGYEVDENRLRFTIDGKVTAYDQNYSSQNHTVSSSAADAALEIQASTDAFQTPMYIRLSLALGFGSRNYIVPDNDDAWQKYNKYITDYVHVYQKTGLTGNSKQTMQILKSYNKQGDVNGDGNIDLIDAAKLERYLADWTRYDFLNLDLGAADMTDDGYVTTEDLLTLKKLLTGAGGFWGDDDTTPTPDTDDDEDEWTPWV